MKSTSHTGIAIGLLVLLHQSPPDCAAAAPNFTDAQAQAGKIVYADHCADCHGEELEGVDISPALVGEKFDQTWRNNSADMLSFNIRRMPPETVGEPGSLGDAAYTNILAYVLKLNGFPAGDAPLPNDIEGLKTVQIPGLPGVDYNPDAPVDASEEQLAMLKNLSDVSDEMLKNPSPNDWLQWGRTYDGQGYSPLASINRENVGDLTPAWRAPLRGGPSMTVPLVHDGIMFLQTYPDTVLAIDATSGMVLWRHQHKAKFGSSHKLGIALYGGKVFVPTSDMRVKALDAKTGELVWDHSIDTHLKVQGGFAGFQLRSAPIVAGGKVIQGVTSTFAPKGGFIVGMYADSGEESWRFNTIARPGQPGGNTWNNVPLEKRSGGSVWHQGTYDPDLNLIYFGVAPTYDTGPLLHLTDKEGHTNDALFTNCTVAVNADTGELVWHYQHMANDQWDLDWVFERQIAEVMIGGEKRKAVMNIGKMAILDALDAATGEYLFSVDTGTQNVITAIDPKTGEKTIDPDKLPDPSRDCLVCPNAAGARSWPPTSFSPETNMVYVPITETCMTLGKEGFKLLTSGVGISGAKHPDAADGKLSRVQAIDIANQKLAWNADVVAPLSTGTLATAGGVVFVGDVEPSLKAFDAANGALLWQTKLEDAPSSSVITYAVNDTQYIAVVVGISNIHINAQKGLYAGRETNMLQGSAPKSGGGAALWVFTVE